MAFSPEENAAAASARAVTPLSFDRNRHQTEVPRQFNNLGLLAPAVAREVAALLAEAAKIPPAVTATARDAAAAARSATAADGDERLAADHRRQTGEDRAQTGRDRSAIAPMVEAVARDAAAALRDAGLTAEDARNTKADRAETAKHVLLTADDRRQTEADRRATVAAQASVKTSQDETVALEASARAHAQAAATSAGPQVGDMLSTLRNPGAGWLRRDGTLYRRAAYPALAAMVPVLKFEMETPGSSSSWNDINYSPAQKRLARVPFSGSTIATSDDNGATWSNRASPFTSTLRFIKWIAGLSLWVAGGDGGQIGTSPDAITWTLGNSGVTTPLFDADGDADRFFVVGDNGVILHSADKGATYSSRSSGTTAGLRGIVRVANIYYVVGSSVSLISVNGEGWNSLPGLIGPHLRVAASSSGRVLAISRTGVVRYDIASGRWVPVPMDTSGESLAGIAYGPAGWAIVGRGMVLTSLTGEFFARDAVRPSSFLYGVTATETHYLVAGISTVPRALIPTSTADFNVPADNPVSGWIKAA